MNISLKGDHLRRLRRSNQKRERGDYTSKIRQNKDFVENPRFVLGTHNTNIIEELRQS